MDNDENKLKKRFAELSLRAVEQRRTVSSDFLTLDEQSTLASAQLFSRVYLYGGYPLAERRAALFGEKSEEEKAAECDFVWVKISRMIIADTFFAKKRLHALCSTILTGSSTPRCDVR